MLSLAATAVVLILAADLTPQKAAEVQNDRNKAAEEIDKKYGGKKSSELTPDERREQIADQRAAEDKILEKHDVDAKDMARYEAKMSLDDRAAAKDALKHIQEKEKLDAETKKAKEEAKANNAKNKEVQVQRGFSDSNPVTLEDKGTEGAPTVEKGLPADAVEDYKSAGQSTPDDVPATKPSKGSGKSKSP